MTDIEAERPCHKDIPDLFFPVAEADITDCSTYAVVSRLKPSPNYTITSTGGLFRHPDYPGVTITIPKNAVAPESRSTLELKVGVIKKVHNAGKQKGNGFINIEGLTEKSSTEYWRDILVT